MKLYLQITSICLLFMFVGCSSDESDQPDNVIDHDQAVRAYQRGNTASGHAMRAVAKDNTSSAKLQWNLAVESYKKAIKLDPKFADAHCALGGAYLNLNRYAESVKSYKQAIEIMPKYVEAYFGMAAALGYLNRDEEAADALKVAIELRPKYAEAHYLLACVYGKMGLINDALASYNRAVDIEPAYAEAPYGPASLYSAWQAKAIYNISAGPESKKNEQE